MYRWWRKRDIPAACRIQGIPWDYHRCRPRMRNSSEWCPPRACWPLRVYRKWTRQPKHAAATVCCLEMASIGWRLEHKEYRYRKHHWEYHLGLGCRRHPEGPPVRHEIEASPVWCCCCQNVPWWCSNSCLGEECLIFITESVLKWWF